MTAQPTVAADTRAHASALSTESGNEANPAVGLASAVDASDGESQRYDDYAVADADADEFSVDEYNVSVAPTDFNVMTLDSLIDKRMVRIPGFQRHFVWDIGRASKLIESLILGLPVPQLFLYDDRNASLVIDGQQRLLSIYYFKRQRFPLPKRRAEIRRFFDEHQGIPEDILNNNKYFRDFELKLPLALPDRSNRLAGLTYEKLNDEDRNRLDMRPVRCINITPRGGNDDAIYEIFNRLNTGGMNLRPQEIRTSMYHSDFYDMLNEINYHEGWRRLLDSPVAEVHMKDVEILLRGFAMLLSGDRYVPSMVKFLNSFSNASKTRTRDDNERLKRLFVSFIDATLNLPARCFMNEGNNRFNIALYEAVFTAACLSPYKNDHPVRELNSVAIEKLRTDPEFLEASRRATTSASNVQTRLNRAKSILSLEGVQ